jgi:signal transduction histidine kinase
MGIMVKKRNSGSEHMEAVHKSNSRRKQPSLAPAGRPQSENLADICEQLRTEVEELRQQVLELHESKSLDARSIRGAEWLARLAEENPDPVLQVSLDGAVQYRNPASFSLCREWNPSDELMVPPAVHHLVEAACARAEVIRREMIVGEHTYSITVSPAPAHFVNIYAREITAAKKAEEARREAEKRLALALSGTRMGMYDRNLITGKIRGTERLAWLLGLRTTTTTLSQVYQYHDWAGRVHPDDWERIETQLHRCLTERVPFEADYRIMLRDGEVRWVADRGIFQYDAGGQPTSIVGILMDITERKRAEEALRDLNASLETKVAQRTAELARRAHQLQKLTLDMSEAEDHERKRLAEILHDDLQQIMAAAKFQLSVIRDRVKDDVSLHAIVLEIDHMLKEAIEKSRGLSHELSPAALYQGDFADALDQLAKHMQAKHGLVVQVHATGLVQLQSDSVKALLYRTAQELLFNAVKHAQVKEARIRVRRLGQWLCLTVSDRGRGFDPQELREAPGFGLLSVRERIESLGGRMKIKSAKGRGSTFLILVPNA